MSADAITIVVVAAKKRNDADHTLAIDMSAMIGVIALVTASATLNPRLPLLRHPQHLDLLLRLPPTTIVTTVVRKVETATTRPLHVIGTLIVSVVAIVTAAVTARMKAIDILIEVEAARVVARVVAVAAEAMAAQSASPPRVALPPILARVAAAAAAVLEARRLALEVAAAR